MCKKNTYKQQTLSHNVVHLDLIEIRTFIYEADQLSRTVSCNIGQCAHL
jgi:hypothetical protein